MIKVFPKSFSAEQFISLSDRHPDEGQSGPIKVEKLADQIQDTGSVKIAGGGGKPFAR
jgi:hypothetical protein